MSGPIEIKIRRIPPPGPLPFFVEVLGILVLNGSGSMEEQTAQHITKADAVNCAVNELFSYFKASRHRNLFSFAIVNYDHRSIVRMQPTPVKDIDDHGNYNPMKGLGGGTYISEGLKHAKKIAEDFLNQSQIDVLHRHVVVTIMTDGIDMTESETISIVNALKRMDHVILTGCFFETVGGNAKAMDEAADYIKGLCSEERFFARVANADDLRQFFINSMSKD